MTWVRTNDRYISAMEGAGGRRKIATNFLVVKVWGTKRYKRGGGDERKIINDFSVMKTWRKKEIWREWDIYVYIYKRNENKMYMYICI